MKGYCICGQVIDEVEFTQFGMCEKCYNKKQIKIKCPLCHGRPNLTYDKNLDCGLCNEKLEVSQKARMEYIRSFKQKEMKGL